jgi:hypothetical protein
LVKVATKARGGFFENIRPKEIRQEGCCDGILAGDAMAQMHIGE